MAGRELRDREAADHDRDHHQHQDEAARDQRRGELSLAGRVTGAWRAAVLVGGRRPRRRRRVRLLREHRRSAPAAKTRSGRERSAAASAIASDRGRHQVFTATAARPCLEAAARAAPQLGQNRMVGTT
jgi:hypothetical protein